MKKQSTEEKMEVGKHGYVNKNCWLVRNLGHPSSERCIYCELKFKDCQFERFLEVTMIMVGVLLAVAYFMEQTISKSLILSLFIIIIVYGYFFKKSTERIIIANFEEKKAKNAFKDLSDNLQKKVDEQTKDIKEKNEHLQELLVMKSDFLKVISHQLNTPLSIIRGYFSMMKEGDYDPKKALPAIELGLYRLVNTVSDFCDAYKLEGEKIKMEIVKVDIQTVIKNVIKEKLKYIEEKKLKLVIKQPDFKIPMVWCDKEMMTRVVSILLENAIVYTNEGSVEIFYALKKNCLAISIKDMGIGLSEDDKTKMFQKFSRGGRALNIYPNGSGLGLYISQKIVEGNEGKIYFESEGENKGATFVFALPFVVSEKLIV